MWKQCWEVYVKRIIHLSVNILHYSPPLRWIIVLYIDIFFRSRNAASPLQFGSSEQAVLAGLRDTCKQINDSTGSFMPFILVQVSGST